MIDLKSQRNRGFTVVGGLFIVSSAFWLITASHGDRSIKLLLVGSLGGTLFGVLALVRSYQTGHYLRSEEMSESRDSYLVRTPASQSAARRPVLFGSLLLGSSIVFWVLLVLVGQERTSFLVVATVAAALYTVTSFALVTRRSAEDPSSHRDD